MRRADGGSVAFGSRRSPPEDFFVLPADGSVREPQLVYESPNQKFLMEWTRDDRLIYGEVFRAANGGGYVSLFDRPVSGEGAGRASGASGE